MLASFSVHNCQEFLNEFSDHLKVCRIVKDLAIGILINLILGHLKVCRVVRDLEISDMLQAIGILIAPITWIESAELVAQLDSNAIKS